MAKDGHVMRITPRRLLVAVLLSSPLFASAQNSIMLDIWMVHHQGDLGKNEVFLVDARPDQILDRGKGVRSLPVYQIHEDRALSDFTKYNVEVDCAKNRVRLKDAVDFTTFGNKQFPVKVSSAWQKSPETWLVQSRDFLCKPAEREARKMAHWGAVDGLKVIERGNDYFRSLKREQSIQKILQIIDQAFDSMPQTPNGETKELVP